MRHVLFIWLLLINPFFLLAQKTNKISADTLTVNSQLGEVSDTVSTGDFFEKDDILKITLKYDITSLLRNKLKNDYFDAELRVFYNENQPLIKHIRIKARGHFRRHECFYPPLFLNFKTSPIENTEFSQIKKVKIATTCSSSERSQYAILKEYLAYRLYNILTDKSFRVRLLDISYIDTGKKHKNYHSYGFVLEPFDKVLERTKCISIDPMLVKEENILETDADRVALYEYLISNSDWRFKSGHNIKYMKSLVILTPKVMPVPYDFDFSGFVDAGYSFVQAWSKAKTIYERDYMGYCRSNDEDYEKNISLFLKSEDDIMKEITDFKFLPDKEKRKVINFTSGFFEEIEKPRDFISTLKISCRPNDF